LPASRTKPNYVKMREESDLSLEVVILLILGVFMFLFGILLFRIHTGELPYNLTVLTGSSWLSFPSR
jgi:hypothetical protein